jgi:hypothetical protein
MKKSVTLVSYALFVVYNYLIYNFIYSYAAKFSHYRELIFRCFFREEKPLHFDGE